MIVLFIIGALTILGVLVFTILIVGGIVNARKRMAEKKAKREAK